MPPLVAPKTTASKKVKQAPSTPHPKAKKTKLSPPPAPKKKAKSKIRLSKETDSLDAVEITKEELQKLQSLQTNLKRPGYPFTITGIFNNQDQFGRLSFFVDEAVVSDQQDALKEFDAEVSLERFPFELNEFWDKNMLTAALATDYNPVIPAKGDLVQVQGRVQIFKPRKEASKTKTGVAKWVQPPKRASAVISELKIIVDPDAVEEDGEEEEEDEGEKLVDDEAEEGEEDEE